MIGISTRRNAGGIGACVVALALLAGCGGAAGDGSAPGASAIAGLAPAQVARQAPDVTRAAGTSRYAVDMTMSTTASLLPGEAPSTTTMTMGGTGTYDFARQVGDGDYTSSGGGLPAERIEVVFRNNVLWQRTAGQARWQEWDFSDLVNTPVGQHDPGQQLDLLRGVSDDVRELGTTEIRGADARHYAITIDPIRLAQQSDVVVEDGLTQAVLRASGPIPAEVFVDEDGRVRRLQVGVSMSGQDLVSAPGMSEALGGALDDPQLAEMLRQRKSEMQFSVEYFDFGVPVTAEVPDPSTVDRGSLVPGPR